MMSGKKIGVALLTLAAVTALGCSGEVVPGDEATEDGTTGTTSQAITLLGGAFWGQFGNSGPDAYLGPDNDRTCYLVGIHGQLKGTLNGSYNGKPAGAYVYRNNGGWYLATRQGGGIGVNAEAHCIPGASNRVTVRSSSFYNPNPPALLIPKGPNRQCFITGVYSYRGFQDVGDWTGLRPPGNTSGADPNNWQFVTKVKPAYDSFGNAFAGGQVDVTCVDVPIPNYGGVERNGTSGAFSSEAGLACGLTFLAGSFFANPPLGGNDGVGVSLSGGVWSAHATSGKQMRTTCVK
ncbi:MAG: hypothetical protein JST00_12370 [Deltaproteobacteria bacterium]|nr:hypothetical protein [Deltaproteobacteria bacterium]